MFHVRANTGFYENFWNVHPLNCPVGKWPLFKTEKCANYCRRTAIRFHLLIHLKFDFIKYKEKHTNWGIKQVPLMSSHKAIMQTKMCLLLWYKYEAHGPAHEILERIANAQKLLLNAHADTFT